MKKYSIAFAMAFSSAANSASGGYVTGKIGPSFIGLNGQSVMSNNAGAIHPGNTTKSVIGGGAAIGYDFYTHFDIPVRTELDLTFRGAAKNDINYNNTNMTNKLRMTTTMINAYYDFHNASSYTPYVSVGVGHAHLNLDNRVSGYSDASGNNNSVAWGAGAGVRFEAHQDILFDLGYKFISAGKVDLSKSSGESYRKVESKAYANDLTFGVAYKF